MDLRLRGRSVLVTGGNRGTGRQIALAFAAEGARVAICARDEERLRTTTQELRDLGGEAAMIVADLSVNSECQRAVDETARVFGTVDVLVNNAATSVDALPATFENTTDEQLMERIVGKAFAAMRCSRAVLPYMRQAKQGKIICIGGMSARAIFRGNELPARTNSPMASGIGNAMLCNFAKHLSEEVAADGISVNVVHPHITRTDRFTSRVRAIAARRGLTEAQAAADLEAELGAHIPLGHIIEPSEIASLVVFLSSPLAGSVTGQVIAVDVGAARSIMY